MKARRKLWLGLLAGVAAVTTASLPAAAQQQQKSNIVFIMADDIGWMQVGLYHRGLAVGETPNIDRISQALVGPARSATINDSARRVVSATADSIRTN